MTPRARCKGGLVHISVVCPYCQTRYQLEPSLRGMRMRCPNPQCCAIFEVREEAEAPTATPAEPLPVPAAPGKQVTGSVGDIVPILPAEPADGASAPAAPIPPAPSPNLQEVVPMVAAEAVEPRQFPKPQWQEPPPIRKQLAGAAGTAAPRAKRPAAPAPIPELDWGPLSEFFCEDPPPSAPAGLEDKVAAPGSNGPVELPAGTWNAPPVRLLQRTPTEHRGAWAGPAAVSAAAEAPAPATRRRRRYRIAIGIMTVFGLALGGAAYWLYQRQLAGNEAQRLERAQEIELSNRHAQVAEDVVSGNDVEIEVRQRE